MNVFRGRVSHLAVPFVTATVSILLACFAFVTTQTVSAVPTTMNFQGRLADTSGNIMPDGLYNMQFRLFTVSTGGTATWTETRETTNRVQVTNGLFSTQLGAVTPITASLFSGNDVYFEITMPTPGTATCGTASCASWESPMTPRNKMATSAYAFQSENANTLDGLDSTAFAAATGSANYIQNTTSPQTADFNVTGTGTAATLQAATFDRATAGALTIGGTNATSIVLSDNTTVNANLTVSAGNSLMLAGGTTASRPGSPVEGMVYYDSETKQLLTYTNGKWQADRSDAVLVAASDSSAADKAAADYIADGNTGAANDGDQVQINGALTAASGKKVVLLAGTYTVDASVSVPNNTTLAGVGNTSLVTIPDSFDAALNAIINTDITTGTGVKIRDLKLDGNKANQSSGTMQGIYMNKMGDGSGGSARPGATISGVYVTNFTSDAISLYETGHNTLTGNTAKDNDASGFSIVFTRNSTLSGNLAAGNGSDGFSLGSSSNNTLTGNRALDNVGDGFDLYASQNTLIGNTSTGNDNGFNINVGSDNVITDNKVEWSYGHGIYLSNALRNKLSSNQIGGGIYIEASSHGNTLQDNTIEGNGDFVPLYIASSDSNIIMENTITADYDDEYAIEIADVGAENNYLSGNYFSSDEGDTVINDLGTGTVYTGQPMAEGGLDTVFKQSSSTAAFQIQNASGTSVFNVDTTNNAITLGTNTSLTLTGGTTASRPVSPVEGMMFYDTDTKQLLTYANGKWQADRSDAVLVAAANSSVADKAAADYVADGNTGAANDGDQVQINSALTAASGKKVVLLAGTYTVDASISIPNNTTLSGVGTGTILTIPNSFNAALNVITNSDTSTGTGMAIRDMKIDGNKSNQSSGSMTGVYLNGVGDVDASRKGGVVTGLSVSNMRGTGIVLSGSSGTSVDTNQSDTNSTGYFVGAGSSANTLGNNVASENTYSNFTISGSSKNTLSANTSYATTAAYGYYLNTATQNNLTANTSIGADTGISVETASDGNIITNNRAEDAVYYGIALWGSSKNKISANSVTDSGGLTANDGIRVQESDSNQVTSNNINDASCTTTCYAINISSAGSDMNYLSGNTFIGDGTYAATIRDIGTATRYVGQTKTEGGLDTLFKQANSTIAFQIQNASSTPLFTVDSTNSAVTIGATNTATNRLTINTASTNDALAQALFASGSATNKAMVLQGSSAQTADLLQLQDSGGTVLASFAANGKLCVRDSAATCGGYGNYSTLDSAGLTLSNQGGNINSTIYQSSNGPLVMASSLGVRVTTGTNATTTFQVQNASSTSLFTIDTANNQIALGASDTTGVILVLDTKTSAGDPTGVDGAMYYNSNMARFRCYESGAWKNCTGANPTNGSTATQGVSAGSDTYLTAL